MTTQTLPENVVEVNIDVEGSLSEVDAFNTVAFFTVSNSTQRNTKVRSLNEVISAGFSEESNAYNFCLGVFNQKKMSQVVIRSVRTSESYLDAYKSFSNNSYYFMVIESKDVEVVLNFRQGLEEFSQQKLLFFSSPEDVSDEVKGLSRLVYYFDPSLSEDSSECLFQFDSGDFVQLDGESFLLPETCDTNESKFFLSEIKTNNKIVGATISTKVFNYLNSYLYPIYTVEDIAIKNDINSAKQRESIGLSKLSEVLVSNFVLNSATQKDVLKTSSLTPENVNVQFKINNATQRDILKTTNSSVENLSAKFSLNSATQKNY